MGTNYYAIPKMTEEQKAEAISAINKDEFSKANSLLPKEVHIGKSSAGWDFLLNHNDWLYYNNYEEMMGNLILQTQPGK